MIQSYEHEASIGNGRLDYKHWYYETAKAAGTCDVPDRMTLEEVPKEHKAMYLKSHSI